MWIASKYGFFSIVQHRDDTNHRQFIVRARDRGDLVLLREAASVDRMISATGSDYPFRIYCSAIDMEKIFSVLRDSIDYPNFKSEIASTDHSRADIYHDAWVTFMQIQR